MRRKACCCECLEQPAILLKHLKPVDERYISVFFPKFSHQMTDCLYIHGPQEGRQQNDLSSHLFLCLVLEHYSLNPIPLQFFFLCKRELKPYNHSLVQRDHVVHKQIHLFRLCFFFLFAHQWEKGGKITLRVLYIDLSSERDRSYGNDVLKSLITCYKPSCQKKVFDLSIEDINTKRLLLQCNNHSLACFPSVLGRTGSQSREYRLFQLAPVQLTIADDSIHSCMQPVPASRGLTQTINLILTPLMVIICCHMPAD